VATREPQSSQANPRDHQYHQPMISETMLVNRTAAPFAPDTRYAMPYYLKPSVNLPTA
jgi:hypothetical protein